jgi:hypothetical protein
MAQFEVVTRHLLEGLRKTVRNLRIDDIPAEIRTVHLLNASWKR